MPLAFLGSSPPHSNPRRGGEDVDRLGRHTEHRLDKCDDASEHALQALESARAIGYRLQEGNALTVLAEIRLAQGRYQEAREYARQALDNHRKTGHRLGEANALTALGSALHRCGDPQAREHWRAARELFTAIGAPVPDELAIG